MSLNLLFLLILVVSFAFVVFFIRPSQTEVAVRRRFATVAGEDKDRPIDSTILKQERFSPSPWVDELLMRVPGTAALLDLVKQSGTDWWVSSIIAGSLLCAFVGGILAQFRFDNSAVILFTAIVTGLLPTGYLFVMRAQRLQKCD